MIFQDPMTSLNPVLTIGFQICESLQKHLLMSRTEAIDRSVELLQMVGMPESRDRLNDYPHQFSGGMRQRVMIAMALSCNPSLIIADEPTTALDVTIQAQILELVKQLRDKSGLSLIWITHDLGIIANLADRVLVMYGGFIVEEACIDDLYNDPRHPYTAALLRSRPRMDGRLGERLENIKGMPPDMLRLIKGCPFAPRCSVVVEKCHLENPTLREVNLEHKAACWIDIRNGRSP
jgi:oligopeptide/dipeptide ABC transporter ATP-binding protein